VLLGMAMRKKNITDPFYMDAEWLEHDAPIKGWKGYQKK